MKPLINSLCLGRVLGAWALASALIVGLAGGAEAAMSKDQIAQKIEREFKVKVLRVEPITEDGKALYAVTVMSPGGNWNHAFQVNTIAVDAATGNPVVQYRQSGGQLREGAAPVQQRTAPMTAEDK